VVNGCGPPVRISALDVPPPDNSEKNSAKNTPPSLADPRKSNETTYSVLGVTPPPAPIFACLTTASTAAPVPASKSAIQNQLSSYRKISLC
jgi:hypothetical protein